MEVKEVLFMNKGEGESSYFQNSSFSQFLAEKSKPVLEKAVQSLLKENSVPLHNVFNIADLGCAASPTTFSVMATVIDTTKNITCNQSAAVVTPDFQFLLNDLPGNDFNTLFKGLSKFVNGEKCEDVSCFAMVVPGSFYGRLFPRNTLHLVHSSYSLCFLSKVPRLRDEAGSPLNKGKIYISKKSPGEVREAYLCQYQQDLCFFLKSRSEEMVANGRVVLILPGRESTDSSSEDVCYQWEVLAEAIASMVSQKLIDEDKLDLFDVPYYVPSLEEMKQVVDKEGSFESEIMETIAIDQRGNNTSAREVTNSIRCFTESMISHHFGINITDILYDKVTDLVIRHLATQAVPSKLISFIVVLKRKI
ncbi:hypothetical protein Q3G72_033206 [Acer saccharum]|nr:hypothetical protein Q3G72_033206 [Acer saccharum]